MIKLYFRYFITFVVLVASRPQGLSQNLYVRNNVLGIHDHGVLVAFSDVLLDSAHVIGSGHIIMAGTQPQAIYSCRSHINNLVLHRPDLVTLHGELTVGTIKHTSATQGSKSYEASQPDTLATKPPAKKIASKPRVENNTTKESFRPGGYQYIGLLASAVDYRLSFYWRDTHTSTYLDTYKYHFSKPHHTPPKVFLSLS
jgi:hypothetical protein